MATGTRYSKSKYIQEICEELEGRGFTFKRGGSHWKMWGPNGRYISPINNTPSDFRSEVKFRGDVRRYLKFHNLPPLERDEKPEERAVTKPFNTIPFPKQDENGTWIPGQREPEVPPPEPQEVFEFDDGTSVPVGHRGSPIPRALQPLRFPEEFDLIKHLVDADDKSYIEVADLLNKDGFTNDLGKPCTAAQLSRWMRDNGFKTRAPRRGSASAVTVDEVMAHRKMASQKFLHEVTEIISSNLSEELKEKYLITTARERLAQLEAQ